MKPPPQNMSKKLAGVFSAVKSRGLIEASTTALTLNSVLMFSAVKSRGLIEAENLKPCFPVAPAVFRGEEPRPH